VGFVITWFHVGGPGTEIALPAIAAGHNHGLKNLFSKLLSVQLYRVTCWQPCHRESSV